MLHGGVTKCKNVLEAESHELREQAAPGERICSLSRQALTAA